MKKIITILVLFFFTGFVYAKEVCTVVSGDGTNIGDEIACGSEHFYVLSNDGSKVRMMTKYNLYVGDKISKIFYDFDNSVDFIGYLRTLPEFMTEPDADKSISFTGYDSKQNKYYALLSERIKEEHVLQNEKAIGFSGEYRNNTNFPFYGVVERFLINDLTPPRDVYQCFPILFDSSLLEDYRNDISIIYDYPLEQIISEEKYNEFLNGFVNTEPEEIDFCRNSYYTYKEKAFVPKILVSYQTELTEMGVEVEKVEMPSIYDIEDIVKKEANKSFNYDKYRSFLDSYDNDIVNDTGDEPFKHLDNLKNYLPDSKYKWLYSTTYYTKTVIEKESTFSGLILVSTLGDICYSGFCLSHANIGGLRPVVTVNVLDIAGGIEKNEQPKQTEEKVNPKTVDIISIVSILFFLSLFYIFVLSKKKIINN